MWHFIDRFFHQFYYPTWFYRYIDQYSFPNIPIHPLVRFSRFRALLSHQIQQKKIYNLGSLTTYPHRNAVSIYQRLIQYNPGNLGDWSDIPNTAYDTRNLEFEVIHKMISLFQGNHNRLSGYVTSGGTEGNMFAMWIGRESLERTYNHNQLCVITTSLTHYSISKSAIINHIHREITPIHEQTWGMDPNGFYECVLDLYKKGFRGFLVPLTIGYTATGTSDDVYKLTQTMAVLKKKLPTISFHSWIDAALNGLIEPFLHDGFMPFSSNYIKAIVVDFHKFGLVPYSAGVVLYRKSLRKNIQHTIDYLKETDATLLGSRSGIPAAAIWMMIHSIGKKGYKKIIDVQMKNKKIFLKAISYVAPHLRVISHERSLSCGILFPAKSKKLFPAWIEKKYSIHAGKTSINFPQKKIYTYTIYKIFFLPHMKKNIIMDFIYDLKHLYAIDEKK